MPEIVSHAEFEDKNILAILDTTTNITGVADERQDGHAQTGS
jgi:hypothetical protein